VCTITNDDIAPSLTLDKIVVNDNGGTAAESAWTLTANGGAAGTLTGPGASGHTDVVSGGTFKAGTYNLSESGGPAGYAASAWSCVKNSGSPTTGSSIALGVGDTGTCTITNNDTPGKIVIVKSAKPASGTFAFTTTGSTSGTGTSWPAGFTLTGSTSGGGNTRTFTVDPGTYTVTESPQGGWVLTGIGGSSDTLYGCVVSGSNGSSGVGDLNTLTATITIHLGDTVTCTFENTGATTRTQGFWATHPQLAELAWFGGTKYGHTFPGVASVLGDTTLCGRPIDTLGKLMGGFWSGISKTSTGGKRSALDQARMQLLQQLLAAELNASAFGASPGAGTIAAWEAAYCGTNQNTIKNAASAAASFNEGGDSGAFTPGLSADTKTAKSIADLGFWDALP
jgi:hypothetical protein